MTEGPTDRQPPRKVFVQPAKPFSEMTEDEFSEFAEDFRQRILAATRRGDRPAPPPE